MERLLESCDKNLVHLDLPVASLDDAMHELVHALANEGIFSPADVPRILDELRQREKVARTVIGRGLSIPHAYMDCIKEPVIAIARLHHRINADAPDGEPIRFVFLLLGPKGATEQHLDSLANIARLMSDSEFRYLARTAETVSDFREAIEQRMSGVPAAEHYAALGEGLRYTARPFGGVWGDIRRRLPHYKADFTDGVHSKCLGSALFLFFACLAPAIIFGGLMDGKTGRHIGVVEMVVASAFCGLVYALFAGQPLIILGGTGPMLIFTGILYEYCADNQIAFLPVYAWVGFWTGVILLVMAAADASCLMRFFTRFADETFAALISIIFIYEAISNLIKIFQRAEAGSAIGHDVALFSLLLALGTFYVASSLSAFRNSHLLVPTVREFLADFGPTLAIISMTAISVYWRDTVKVEELPAPSHFQTSSGRPWMVPFWHLDRSMVLLTFLPALLCALLVFLDQNITARLVNSPDNNLQKGESYHLDLGIVGILIAICSLFGLPWLVAATVRSLNHLRSLATTEDVLDQAGGARTRILHVRENRVTGIVIHVLIGLSLLLLPLLKYIPLPVLFGLFLYMGVVSMKGNQFFQRLSLWATDPDLYPTTHFVRRVPRGLLHRFTLIQLACLVVLWIVKQSAWGILFPLFIAALVPIRIGMGRFFDQDYLEVLDADEPPAEEEETWS